MSAALVNIKPEAQRREVRQLHYIADVSVSMILNQATHACWTSCGAEQASKVLHWVVPSNVGDSSEL